MSRNRYDALLDSDDESDEDNVIESEEELIEIKKLKELPDEVQVRIFAYLPHRIRLAILHEKYPYKYYSEKLNRLPVTRNTFNLLYKYACMVFDLVSTFQQRGSWYKLYGTVNNSIDWMYFTDELHRRGNFVEDALQYENVPVKHMIINAFRYYREIYLRDRSGNQMDKREVRQHEKTMLKLYAFIANLNVQSEHQ